MNNDLKYWIAISQFAKIGANRFKKLYNHFPDMKAAWEADLLELQKSGLEENIAREFYLTKEQIDPDTEMEKIQTEGINALTVKDEDYPELLKEIFNPPALLYIKGNIKNFNCRYNLAVVGTRKISNYGKQITPKLVKPLAQNGFTIVSGLAIGVDALAHQSAVDVQGKTIAVLGSGLDTTSIYPSSNRYIAKNILEHDGTIISEFPIGMLPLKHNFPIRNRIISGLSLGTLVIEAAETSGALITAYIALEQNREVFAVPGSIYNENSIGTNKLIQKGAKLITNYQEILEELNLNEVKSYISNQLVLPQTTEEKLIYKNLNHEPKHIDDIIKSTKLTASLVSGCLSLMEMKGMIKNLGGQNYILL
ncbi:MAG: DNA-processing protein DprA [Candidatus Parcubacteria bacterium]|nr:DNA-processing protein DprA [Candidatus Parcubacteria bacterium]